ncbi:armadillo-type protein [Kalaharituber pfeilii]|nr:armadillo-type protein [Kalaharituber pfeilii]
MNTDLEAVRKAAFQQLKPHCVAVSELALSSLAHPLENLLSAVRALGNYIFFPLGNLSDRVVELALRILAVLIGTCWRVDQLVILITFIVGGPLAGKGDHRTTSEECKIAGCDCLKGLFQAMALSKASKRHVVSTFADSAELGRECINDVGVLASFFPGVVSQLSKVLAPQQRTTKPIGVLEYVIITVLGDEILDKSSPKPVKGESGSAGKEALKIQRSEPWFIATAGQTKVALEGIPAVRKALMGRCLKALKSSQGLGLVVDTLVILSADDDQEVSKRAEFIIQVYAVTVPEIGNTLQESVHGWILSLPRIMVSNDEDLKTRLVKRIGAGYKLLGLMGKESNVLRDMIAQNIRDSLESTRILSGKEKIEAQTASTADLIVANKSEALKNVATEYPELVMVHHTQKDTVKSLRSLLETIGKGPSEPANALVRTYLREARDGSSSSWWIAVNLLRCMTQDDEEWLNLQFEDPDSESLTQELFSEAQGVLTDATAATAYLADSSPQDTLSTCLALESIALVAERQREAFKDELVDVIYPLIHLLGSPSNSIQSHSIVTLNKVALACGYSSSQAMILDNVDYVVNSLALKFNTFDISPQAPQVLGMVVKLAGKQILPFLDDVVESVFSTLASYHGYQRLCEGLFGALREIVRVGIEDDVHRGWKMVAGRNVEEKNKTRPKRLSKKGLMLRLAEDAKRRKQVRLEKLNQQMGKDKEGKDKEGKEEFPCQPWGKTKEEKRFNPEANPPEPSSAYKMVQKITNLTQHYLTHPSPGFKLQLLQLVGMSSGLLGQNEKEYLPIVNDVWPVLFERLFDEETHVVVTAAGTIANLAQVCGDFISSRVNEGWCSGGPAGSGISGLMRATKEKVDHERGSRGGMPAGPRFYSPGWKVWNALLGLVEGVVRGCMLEERVFDEMLELCGGVLEAEEGRRVKEVMWEVNPDAVWLEMERRVRLTKVKEQSNRIYNALSTTK